ncbi:MAG: TerB family tellurite resistance protein [Planctomycetota bacterium]|nr:TerB family tellurite resistance protein [Planctomycetota bacterium]
MPISETEALASLRVVLCVAKSDGVIQPEERSALEDLLNTVKLPEGATLDGLLQEQIDLNAELGKLKSSEAKDSLFQSAYSMAHADGKCTSKEQVMLDTIRGRLGISEESYSLLGQLYGEFRDTLTPSGIVPIHDAEKRRKEVDADILKYSLIATVLGANPVPLVSVATDIIVIGIQVKMIRDVGQYWNHKVDRAAAKSLMMGALGSTAARIAVTNLIKFVPGWGSLVGAAASFATTWGLGRVADQYFASGGKMGAKELREAFKSAKKEGEKAYQEHKGEVEAKQAQHKATIDRLNAELKAGKITEAEYQNQLDKLN